MKWDRLVVDEVPNGGIGVGSVYSIRLIRQPSSFQPHHPMTNHPYYHPCTPPSDNTIHSPLRPVDGKALTT